MQHLYIVLRLSLFAASIICLSLIVATSYAQVPTDQDCLGAIPVCSSIYTTPSSTFGSGNYPNEDGPLTCLVPGEQNSLWFIFTVIQSGDLAFTTNPVTFGADYDWALYNITNASCADIQTNGSLQVSCNSSQWGVTGISAAGVGNWNGPGFTNAFNYLLPVNAGETYVLNMNNWSSSLGGYTLNFGASTAVIFDSVPPSIDTVLPVICNATQLTFSFSEKILCNTVQDADFALTGPGGPYLISGVTGASCSLGGSQEITFTANVSPAITEGGTYYFHLTNNSGSVTDLCGNVADTMTYPFFVSAVQAVLDSTTQPTCAGSNGAIYVSGTVGTPPYVFSFDGGPYVSSGSFTGLDSGTFIIVVKDSFACDDTIQIHLTPATGAVTATVPSYSDISCFNACDGWIVSKATGGVPPYTYAWTNSSSTSDTALSLCPNTYKVTITDSMDCFDTVSITLVEPPDVIFDVQDLKDATCYGYKDGSVTLHPTGGTPPYTYIWTPYGGGSATASGLEAGSYGLLLIDVHQCNYDTMIVIGQPDPVVINYPGDTTICLGTPADLYVPVIGGFPSYSVVWDGGLSTDNPYTVNPLVNDSFLVVAFDSVGCYSYPATYYVNVLNQTVVELGNDTVLCAGDSMFLNVYYPNAEYLWQDGVTDYKRYINIRGTYWVDVYNQCFTARDSLILEEDDCGTCVHVPNAFTPNHDGINDVFKPQIGCVFDSYFFKIFNRWGQMVFETTNVDEGWNGLYSNKPSEVGNYVWSIEYHGTQHSRTLNEFLKGSVLLIR